MLAGEVKSIKQQMQTLLQKGHNDDELIAALMVSSGLAQNGMGWNGLEQDGIEWDVRTWNRMV